MTGGVIVTNPLPFSSLEQPPAMLNNSRMQPVAFKPHGPFALPYTRTHKGTTFDTDHLWSKGQAGPLAKGRGCYILAVKRGKTVLPIYVGLTRASFDREIFNPSNCRKYHDALKGARSALSSSSSSNTL